MSREQRDIDGVEVRDVGGRAVIVGRAAVFNSFSSDLGGFQEIVRPGAFKRALESAPDVRALFNHDKNFVLGRLSAGTLRLVEDERGLSYEIDPPPSRFAEDLVASIRRKDITGSSFAFGVRHGGESWRTEGPRQIRELTDLDLFDVSVVTFPAYPAADVALRSLDAWRRQLAAPPAAERDRLDRRLKLAERR